MPVATSVIDRFWQNVDKDGPDGCWLWTGPVSSNGYGQIGERKKYISVHRLSFKIHNGRFPAAGLVVRHTCDVRNCVNPAHLLEGTQADNVRDRVEHGIHLVGEQIQRAVLTADIVREMRKLHSSGISGAEVSRRLSQPKHRVYQVLAGKTWKHVA